MSQTTLDAAINHFIKARQAHIPSLRLPTCGLRVRPGDPHPAHLLPRQAVPAAQRRRDTRRAAAEHPPLAVAPKGVLPSLQPPQTYKRPQKSQAAGGLPTLLRQHAFESHVLSKTLYAANSHPPESCDWINVLLAQVVARYRSDPTVTANMVKWIDAKLNAGISGANSQPSFLGPVTITDFSLGEEYMKFANARIRYAEQSSNLRAEVEFEYNDQITIGVDTQVILNWPKPAIASLPVSLVLSVVRFSGTLGVEFVSLPDSSETFFAVSVLPPVALEFDVRSLLGHRTKVKDLPKLTALITSQLRTAFVDEIVWPSFKRIPVPILFSDHGSGAVVPEMPAAATAALVPDGALPADVGSGESKDR